MGPDNITTGQARSQDLEKGGAIWKSEKCANDLDPNFDSSWISFTRFVRKFRRNFSESSEIQTFFPPKVRWSPKKKQKKKGLHRIWDWFFGRNRKFKRFFRPKSGGLLKKKKKGLHRVWDWFFGPNWKSKRLRGAIFLWGGYFQFFTKNRPQNHQKGAILHTSQADGGAQAPPPWLRYCHRTFSANF